MAGYHRPRHPCAGTDSFLAERARARLAPKPFRPPRPAVPVVHGFLRALAAMRPITPLTPKSADEMFQRLRLHLMTLQEPCTVDVATLTARLNLLPAGVPLLRQALEQAAARRLATRAGRSPYGEMLFRLEPLAVPATVDGHEQGQPAGSRAAS
ncbi:hypothetical protein [Streptomyces albogriseolus]|uniref:hypothetical protein n=1 Tax=Streptomyces albogriseolus TaxID=1887 RepID=UPI003460A158